jgi:hypothetical protein
MSGVLSRFSFKCEKCKKYAQPSAIRANLGECKCKSANWALEIEIEHSDGGGTEIGVLAVATALTLGFSAGTGRQIETERIFLSNVTADEANSVCEKMFGMADRVIHLLVERQKQDEEKNRRRLNDQGAAPCRHCGVLVIPKTEKPWTLDGTCSKVCCARANGVATYPDIEPTLLAKARATSGRTENRSGKGAKISVQCGCGETFSVPHMYAETMRPCTKCGVKVFVKW